MKNRDYGIKRKLSQLLINNSNWYYDNMVKKNTEVNEKQTK